MDDKDEQQQQSSSTKVYYHLDDSTPYMSEIQVPADQLTLGDFKRNFVRKGYSYFCKEWDPDLRREVKVEISHDRQLLQKSANGLIELFLLSQNSISQRGAGTLPKVKIGGKKANGDVPMNHLVLSTMATNSEIDVGGGQRVSMATITEASSDVQTLISKRAGENLAAIYNSTSEDPYYNRTSISSSGIFPRLPAPLPSAEESTIESATAQIKKQPQKFRRNGRKQCRKAYVPSTISSESESSYSLPRIEEVKLRLKEAPLGISVASQDGSIFIYHIQPGSAAEKCNQLEIGDQIIQVNETRFEDLNEAQALELLKKLTALKRTVIMYVAKRKRVNGESSEERKSDALSLLCETQQLDISQWVESTKQNCAEPIQPFMDIPPTEGTSQNALDRTKQQFLGDHPLMGDAKTNSMAVEMQETSDEEAAAYMDRRNGVGARLVPALAKAGMEDRRKAQNNKATIKITNEAIGQAENPSTSRPFLLGLPSTANPCGAAEPAPSNSNSGLPPRAQQPLHAAMDPKVILRRMVEPDSGLTIRNRKWLKIPVPMSFIGDEMVDWLLANVQGFRDRKGAKSFAAKLLQLGLIKHVVNTTAFSQNCYYIFDDEIIASRIAKLGENEGSKKSSVTKSAQQQHSVELGGANKNRGPNGGAAGPPESTTEITYMSNPSSPFFGPSHSHQIHPLGPNVGPSAGGPPQLVIANNPRYVQAPNSLNLLHKNDHSHPIVLDKNNGNSATAAIPLRTLNPPKIGAMRLPLWPISPIVPFPTANANSRKECESPEATNEYASMIQGEINCGAQFDAQLDGIGPSPPTPLQKAPLLDTLNNAQQQQNASSTNSANGNKNSIHQNPNPITAPPSVVLLPAPPLPQRQFVPKTQP